MNLLAFSIRSNFARISIVLILFQIILLYIFFDTVKNSINPKLKFPAYKKYSAENLIKGSVIKSVQSLRNQIWEQLDESIFFKRTSAFYIIERKLLRIFFVCTSQSKNELFGRLEIELEDNQVHHIHLKDGNIKQHAAFGNYVWKSLSFNLDLKKYIKFDDYEDIFKRKKTFHLYLSNVNSQETPDYIDVKMKYIRSRSNTTMKKNSIVCSKCFWYKPSDYKDFFWWVELHKQAGYEKIVFCNNSIPNTKEFNEIFENNKNFIELSQLNYLPNFVDNNQNRSSKSHNYINNYHQLGSYYHVDSDLFNMMITNECFLNNTHKYSHVSVIDNDEIIMPRVNSKLIKTKDNFDFISNLNFNQKSQSLPNELTSLESSCSNDMENKLENYLKSFTTKPVTFHFHMGFYLREKQIRQIIETFEAYFNDSIDYSKIHKIQVIDQLPAVSDHNVYNFTFVLNNKLEINYAKNLCKIYRYLIDNFEEKNNDEIQKYSERFHRFFYIGGLLSSFACGKSSHSTDVSFEFSVHYPEPDKDYPNQAELYSIGYDYGQLSHFRHVNEFHKSSQKEISITELILDLNYLNCFYKPIVEKFSKIKLF